MASLGPKSDKSQVLGGFSRQFSPFSSSYPSCRSCEKCASCSVMPLPGAHALDAKLCSDLSRPPLRS